MISLFSGALGLDLGVERAGFEIRVAVECNRFAAETIRRNRPDIHVIERKLDQVTTDEILQAARVKPGETAVVTAGPSCQTFSTAGRRGSIRDPRGNMFREFLRVVREARPQYFVMENVPGVISAAVKHRPLKERGPGYPHLEPQEELGSAFRVILKELVGLDYFTIFDILTAADFGVPQVRKRAFFLGSRDGRQIKMPLPTHADAEANGRASWVSLREALRGLRERPGDYYDFPPSKKRMLRRIPEGGNWRDLPESLQREALGKAFVSWGGRVGFYRRLSWDRPCPALTTRPDSKATTFCHPDKLRPLSIAEYRRIQTFPDDWQFAGPLRQQFTQAGNAVPVLLGEAIGAAIRKSMRSRTQVDPPGAVVCRNPAVVKRMSARPRTVLNPSRMRKERGVDAARAWLGNGNNRAKLLKHFVLEVDETSRGQEKEEAERIRLRRLRQKAHRVTTKLDDLYGSPRHGNLRNPLDELIYIVLSQMTTGPSYGRVFRRLKRETGTWDEALTMPTSQLRKLIEDAGLSRQKAPRIKSVLRRIAKEFGSLTLAPLRRMTDEEVVRFLCSLPGVGVKTAKCVMMYSLNREVLPVDTHVHRVAVRLGLLEPDVATSAIHDALERVVVPRDRYALHVNALAHGRAMCSARHPQCDGCPMRRVCLHVRAVAR